MSHESRNFENHAPNGEKLDSYESYKVQALQRFNETFKPDIDLICYPFCAIDLSPWAAFPDKDTIGIDSYGDRVQWLQKRGAGPVVCADVLDIDLSETVDLLLPFGWKVSSDTGPHIRSWMKAEGYILTDSLWNVGFFTGLYKSEMDIVGRIDQHLNVETATDSSKTPEDLAYLRRMAKEWETPQTNPRIALEAEAMKPDTYRQNIFIIKVSGN